MRDLKPGAVVKSELQYSINLTRYNLPYVIKLRIKSAASGIHEVKPMLGFKSRYDQNYGFCGAAGAVTA